MHGSSVCVPLVCHRGFIPRSELGQLREFHCNKVSIPRSTHARDSRNEDMLSLFPPVRKVYQAHGGIFPQKKIA